MIHPECAPQKSGHDIGPLASCDEAGIDRQKPVNEIKENGIQFFNSFIQKVETFFQDSFLSGLQLRFICRRC